MKEGALLPDRLRIRLVVCEQWVSVAAMFAVSAEDLGA